MLIVASLLLFSQARATVPGPPFKREATVPVFKASYGMPGVAIIGNQFFSCAGDEVVSYQFPKLTRLWSFETPNELRAESIAAMPGLVYVTTEIDEDTKTGQLIALDSKTGKKVWSLTTTVGGSPIAVTTDTLYVSLTPSSVSAINLKTKKPKWTVKFPPPKADSYFDDIPDAIEPSENRVFVNMGAVTYGLDAATGKQLWREPGSYLFKKRLLVSQGVVWVPSGEGSVGRSVKTGRVLWKKETEGYGEGGAVFNHKFVDIDRGQLSALVPATGKVAWKHEVGPAEMAGGNQSVEVLGGRLFATGLSKSVIIDSAGKRVWEGERGLPHPCWTGASAIVCFDGERLLRYVHGAEAAPPTDATSRRAMAESLLARYEQLDASEIKQLEQLGDDAFEPLLNLYLKLCTAYDAAIKDDKSSGNTYALYSKRQDTGKSLATVGSAKRTGDVLAALDKCEPESSAKALLLSMLAASGDPSVVTPHFIRELEGAKTPGFEMYESATYVARTYIINSRDPRAVAFMIKQVKDPKADPVLRNEAYLHVAGTGGQEGLDAVLAARNQRTLLEPVSKRATAEYLDPPKSGKTPKPLAERADANGTVWGLLESSVLGSNGDLWLAQKDASGAWTNAYFAGVSTKGVSKWFKPQPPEPTFEGKTAKQLAAGEWFKVLLDSPELTKDSDGDGLTDIMERRLGTNAKSNDTDGDGDNDGVDPWPNAALRATSDAEQLLMAAFEARYHEEGHDGVGLFFAPKDMMPFELPGRKGPVIWTSAKDDDRWKLPLEQCYEQGVAFIQFAPVGGKDEGPWEDLYIKWNKDRTEGDILISTYYGGLNGSGYSATVKKFGDKWVVIRMRMEYVS